MTRDSFGDLEPAWSPDGTRIAFVTERFSTNLDWLDIGNYELALLDPETARVEKVLAFPSGKNINPQWSPDSKSLFFVSDQSGKSDLYRIELGTGKIRQITNLYAGISGITELSPAISVAQENGRLAFSGYDQGRYSIYAIDDPGDPRGPGLPRPVRHEPGDPAAPQAGRRVPARPPEEPPVRPAQGHELHGLGLQAQAEPGLPDPARRSASASTATGPTERAGSPPIGATCSATTR